MKTIVVTGGIGSGKSLACRFLSEMGVCSVYDADSRVKGLYVSHPEILDRIESEFGCSFRNADGAFNPSLMAELLFRSPEKLEFVESVVFPALDDDYRVFLENCNRHCRRTSGLGSYVVFESATILEKRQFETFGDIVLLVDAPYCIRLTRAMRRDGKDETSVRLRMDNQKVMNAFSDGSIYSYPEGSVFARAAAKVNVVIDNSSSEQHLREQLVIALENLKLI